MCANVIVNFAQKWLTCKVFALKVKLIKPFVLKAGFH